MNKQLDGLRELKKIFPNEFCRIRTDVEFWPNGLLSEPEETSSTITIQIGWPRGQQFSSETLNGAIAQVHSEHSLCAECSYSIDNFGLCVMDTAHKGYRLQV